MTKFICDRCKSESSYPINKVTFEMAEKPVIENKLQSKFDLCNACTGEVKSMVNKI